MTLAAGSRTPSPEQVVDRARRRLELPGSLGNGSPQVGFLLRRRAQGAMQEQVAGDPESPRARLERTLVLRYPSVVKLDAIIAMLERDPHILSAERNRIYPLSVTPNDPLFQPVSSPYDYQWGSQLLQLPAAWDYTKGNAYVGIIDTGIDTDHDDLQALRLQSGSWSYLGGNFRPQLSYDYTYNDSNVDEGQPQVESGSLRTVAGGGHGTHVAGIVAATADNNLGVAGVCWHCSLMIARANQLQLIGGRWVQGGLPESSIVEALTDLTDKGAQLVNMSFGRGTGIPDCTSSTPGAYCDALAYAHRRDLVMVAASGNDGASSVDFPASHPDVVAAGGVVPGGGFWNTCDSLLDTADCPSNSGSDQELVAPARQVLSTFYVGLPYAGTGCDDNVGAGGTGYGPCTGTSMASPYTTGSAALVRSVNPLLSEANVRYLLDSKASNNGTHNSTTGYGIPNVLASVQGALGQSAGTVLGNRLTPLFSLYSSYVEDHFYTTVPQMAAAALLSLALYSPVGSPVPGYTLYPGTECQVGPCISTTPTASVYVFTTDRAPFTGALPLVPLYRLSFKGTNPNGNTNHRDTNYTTEAAGILAFKSAGYELDGIEGYIYQKCTPEPSCMPAGTVRLYRRYNTQRDDFAIFPESELTAMVAQGYTSNGGVSDVLGYVYPNADTDSDTLINGFELLAGTSQSTADSDCDGTGDGSELLTFGTSGYLDPQQGPCGTVIFADVGPGHWARSYIEAIYVAGVTAGCATDPLRYCPDATVSRDQMAIFLLRAKEGSSYVPPAPNCSAPIFADVPCTYWAAAWIEELYRRGITGGCATSPLRYCPGDAVNRAQMAVFLLRAKEGASYTPPSPNCSAPTFGDVPCTYWAASWIEELARRGITSGCGGGNYCPESSLNRAQMAVFLVTTFNIPFR